MTCVLHDIDKELTGVAHGDAEGLATGGEVLVSAGGGERVWLRGGGGCGY